MPTGKDFDTLQVLTACLGLGDCHCTGVFLQGDNFEMYKSDFNPLTVGFRGSSNRNPGGRGEGRPPQVDFFI